MRDEELKRLLIDMRTGPRRFRRLAVIYLGIAVVSLVVNLWVKEWTGSVVLFALAGLLWLYARNLESVWKSWTRSISDEAPDNG